MLPLGVARLILPAPRSLFNCSYTRFYSVSSIIHKYVRDGKEGNLHDHYNKIARIASLRCEDVSHSLANTLLSQFVEHKYDTSRLRGFLPSTDQPTNADVTLEEYFVILKVCHLQALTDLDLIASFSDNIRLSFLEAYGEAENSDLKVASRHKGSGGSDKDGKAVSHKNIKRSGTGERPPPFMDSVKTLCILFNELKILYDPLFRTIGSLILEHKPKLSHYDVELLLRTYAGQNYRYHALIDHLVSYVEDQIKKIELPNAVSFYKSMGSLDVMDPQLTRKMETLFSERIDGPDGVSFKFKEGITLNQLIDVGYTKFIQGYTDNEPFCFVKSVLEALASKLSSEDHLEQLPSKDKRKIILLTAFLKCLSEPLYNTMGDEHISTLKKVISSESGYKKFGTTKFVEKVSEHLTKLRIRHETNVYANGVLLDIVEKTRNVVWLCNSYHRFYATSFDLTAESRALDRLIRAFGFKTCAINYYQWGRLKAKRTRYAYIRMARYYASNDHRQYDHKYAGWSLPYVWWNVSRQDQMHISNYIKYEP